jgi:hypothetical protein
MPRKAKGPLDPNTRRPDGTVKEGVHLNRKGRPRGSKNKGATRWEILQELVPVKLAGKRKRMPVGEALFRQTVIKALAGDQPSIALALRELAKLEEQQARTQEPTYDFTDKDREIIAEIYDRMKACEPPHHER